MRMTGKGLARLALLIVTAVLGAGVAVGALGGSILILLAR
jgi:hypothetical protein